MSDVSPEVAKQVKRAREIALKAAAWLPDGTGIMLAIVNEDGSLSTSGNVKDEYVLRFLDMWAKAATSPVVVERAGN